MCRCLGHPARFLLFRYAVDRTECYGLIESAIFIRRSGKCDGGSSKLNQIHKPSALYGNYFLSIMLIF